MVRAESLGHEACGAEALQLRLQAIGVSVPHEFLLAVPYLLTVIVIAAFAGKAAYPAALNTPNLRRTGPRRPPSLAE
jgi:ABC-type uncharacterized transport system permease subunit